MTTMMIAFKAFDKQVFKKGDLKYLTLLERHKKEFWKRIDLEMSFIDIRQNICPVPELQEC